VSGDVLVKARFIIATSDEREVEVLKRKIASVFPTALWSRTKPADTFGFVIFADFPLGDSASREDEGP